MPIGLTAYIKPKNDGFQGMIDHDQIISVGDGFKDEDDMASDSATAFCSQQSIKAYVDASVVSDHGGLDGLSDDDHSQYFLLAGETTDAQLHSGADLIVYSDAGGTEKARWDGTTGHIGIGTAPVEAFAIKTAEDIQLTDEKKVTLGTGGDGEIYSSSDNLYIDNSTTDKDILLRVSDGGDMETVLQAHGDSGILSFPEQSGFLATRTTDQTIANNSITQIQYATEVYDYQSEYDPSSKYQWVATEDGRVDVEGGVVFKGTISWNEGEIFALYLYKNGSHLYTLDYRTDGGYSGGVGFPATLYPSLHGAVRVDVETDDTLDLRVYQNTGTSEYIDGTVAVREKGNFFCVHKSA